jgi:hypothetical protein
LKEKFDDYNSVQQSHYENYTIDKKDLAERFSISLFDLRVNDLFRPWLNFVKSIVKSYKIIIAAIALCIRIGATKIFILVHKILIQFK